MIRFFLGALFCLSAYAQTLTTVSDTLYQITGAKYNGQLSIQANSTFTDAGGRPVPLGPAIGINVVNGVLLVTLEPNDTANPQGVSYTVTYTSGRTTIQEIWRVPTSASPVNLATIRTNPAPPITYSTLPASGIVGIVAPINGGTGVNNGSFTETLSQSLNFSLISGITQCLHESPLGIISGTGSDCGSGGGGSGITQLTGPVTAGPGTGVQTTTITPTGVTAATYGDSTHVSQVTVGADGRITAASNVSFSGGTGPIVITNAPDTSGSTTAYTSTANPSISSLTSPNNVYAILTPQTTNTGAITLNLSTTGAKSVVQQDGTGMVGGQMQSALPYLIAYDPTGGVFREPFPTLTAGGTSCLVTNKGVSPPTVDINPACVPTLTGANSGTGAFTGLNQFNQQILLNPITAPSASSGVTELYADGTTLVPSGKDASGNVTQMYRPTDCSGSSQLVQKLNANGTVTCASGSGGGSLTSGLEFWPWGAPGFSGAFGISTFVGFKAVESSAFVLETGIAFTKLNFYIEVASGNSCVGGTCGAVFAIYNISGSSALCVTSVVVSGGTPNLNATGPVSIGFASGADVSGGTCTLPAGGYTLMWTDDSSALTISAYNTTRAVDLMNVNTQIRAGYSPASTATGDGATLAIPANMSGVTFSRFPTSGSGTAYLPIIVFEVP